MKNSVLNAGSLKVINTEKSSYLRFIPAHFEKEEHEVYVYGCEDTTCSNIVRATKDPLFFAVV